MKKKSTEPIPPPLFFVCVVVVVVVVLCYEDDIDRYQIRREQRDKDEVGVRELAIRMAD